jgi:hypothetical protein
VSINWVKSESDEKSGIVVVIGVGKLMNNVLLTKLI